MKEKLLTLIVSLIGLATNAQVTVFLNPIQGLELRPSHIFSGNIQNTSGGTLSIYLQGSIINTANGEVMVTSRTPSFEVQPGVKYLSEPSLAPVYTVQSAIVGQTGVLPYGTYRVCLKAVKTGGVEEVGSDCQESEVVPTSPPLLLSPENQSTVDEQNPLLIWIPPMPVSKDNVVFDLKLVEMLPNQTPYDAIQRNFSIIDKHDIRGTTLQYPANAIQLLENKKYAWQVTARTSSRMLIGETEVWWFTKGSIIQKDPKEKKDPLMVGSYTKFKSKVDGDYVVFSNTILLEYQPAQPKDSIETCKLIVTDLKNKPVAEIKPEMIRSVGFGKYEVDISELNAIKREEFYILTIKRQQEVLGYLSFKSIK